MATYTDEQLQTAASRLREIYDVQTRAERLRTARRFGYTSKPDSRLRIYRRITRGKAKPNSRFDATKYLNDYVLRFDQDVLDNDGEEMVLNGKVPPYSFSENMRITSRVVFVAVRFNGNADSWDASINVNPFLSKDYDDDGVIRRKTPDRILLDPMQLLLEYQKSVRERFERAMVEMSYPIVAIAFNRRGAEVLSETYGTGDIDMEIDLGAAFIPTSYLYIDDKRQPTVSQEPTFRPFPKARQERIVKYVNRAYPQLKRSGRL
jgi:hypothetical protein